MAKHSSGRRLRVLSGADNEGTQITLCKVSLDWHMRDLFQFKVDERRPSLITQLPFLRFWCV